MAEAFSEADCFGTVVGLLYRVVYFIEQDVICRAKNATRRVGFERDIQGVRWNQV